MIYMYTALCGMMYKAINLALVAEDRAHLTALEVKGSENFEAKTV